MKDIFIDANVAKNFDNPLSIEYKELISWLLKEGTLVLSSKIIAEYGRHCMSYTSRTNIAVIIKTLREHQKPRTNEITNTQLKSVSFTKRQKKYIHCNSADEFHIKAILLSNRRIALAQDRLFRKSLNEIVWKGLRCSAVKKPSEIDYVNFKR